MRTLFFILPFIFITTGCIKQNTEKSDILTTEDIAKFDSLFNAWEKEIHNKRELLASMYIDMKEGVLSDSDYVIGRNILNSDIEDLKNQISALRDDDELTEVNSITSGQGYWDTLVQKYQGVTEITSDVVESFIDAWFACHFEKICARLAFGVASVVYAAAHGLSAPDGEQHNCHNVAGGHVPEDDVHTAYVEEEGKNVAESTPPKMREIASPQPAPLPRNAVGNCSAM